MKAEALRLGCAHKMSMELWMVGCRDKSNAGDSMTTVIGYSPVEPVLQKRLKIFDGPAAGARRKNNLDSVGVALGCCNLLLYQLASFFSRWLQWLGKILRSA